MSVCERCHYQEIAKNGVYCSTCMYMLSHNSPSIMDVLWWPFVDEAETDRLFLGNENKVPCKFLMKNARNPVTVRLRYEDGSFKDASPNDISSRDNWEKIYSKPTKKLLPTISETPEIAVTILDELNIQELGSSRLDYSIGSDQWTWHKCTKCEEPICSQIKYLRFKTGLCEKCMKPERAAKVAEIRIVKRTEKRVTLTNAQLMENLGYGSGVYSCNSCQTEYEVMHSNIAACHDLYGTNCCPTCKEKRDLENCTALEHDINEFIHSVYNGAIVRQHDIGSYAADFYLPDLGLIIEADGAFWHSEHYDQNTFKSFKKKNLYDEMNLKSIFIRDIEWHSDKAHLFKEKLKYSLSESVGVRASKLGMVKLDYPEMSPFLEAHHFMGKGERTAMNYALTSNEQIVAVASFKYREEREVELVRFASSQKVYGGLSKIIKTLLRDEPYVREIFTFADRRFSQKDNNLYTNSGFKFEKISNPSYFWLKGRTVILRRRAQKQFIPKEFGDISEADYYHSLGYNRVYDCGNYKYRLCR